MARKRMIDPDIWQDEKFSKLDFVGRLFFIGLITQANDYGKLRGNPKLLKSLIFPYDDNEIQIEKHIKKIVELGIIQAYEINKETFIKIKNWDKYQVLMHPAKDTIPEPIQEGINDISRDTQEDFKKVSRDLQPQVKLSKDKLSKDNIYSIFDHWNSKHSSLITHRQLTDKIETKIKSRLKENTEEEIKQAIDNYAEVLSKPEVYYFNYKWTLADFLQRGVEKFLTASEPFNNFKKRGDINAKGTGNAIRDIKYTPKQRSESTV